MHHGWVWWPWPRSEIPLLCCCWWGGRKDLQILFSILSPESLFCGACWKGAEGEEQFCLRPWLLLQLIWTLCDDAWEDWDFGDDFYFPVRINEISGVAQAGNVIAITVCRESKGKKRKQLLFLDMFDKNWDVNLSLESARWIPWTKSKAIHKELVFCGFVSLFSGNPHAKHPSPVVICLPV